MTSFVGRRREVAEVKRLLGAGRLLTLTGAPGAGKTRLALRAAAELDRAFPDGVYFVPLAVVDDPADVLPTIADVFRLDLGSAGSLVDRLVRRVAQDKSLLVLDNFEHVVEGAPPVGALLAGCPRLAVLATSRRAVGLYGERELPLEPLPLPPSASGHGRPRGAEGARVERYDAVRLFVERARDVRPSFALTDENAAAVAELCRQLDGLPLAIELAARRMRTLAPGEMLAHLEHERGRLDLLAGGAHDLPARHWTLRDAIAASYDLLDDGARRLLRRLAVFAGGFTAEAAGAVDGADPVGLVAALDAVVQASLVEREEGASGTRFRLLETIRDFALERLAAAGEEEETRRRHARHYLELGERAVAERERPGESGPERIRATMDELVRELDNMRAALRWSTQRGDRALAGALAHSLHIPLHALGHNQESRRYTEAVLRMDWSDEPAALIRAQLLGHLASLLVEQGERNAAGACQEEALAIFRSRGDTKMTAGVLRVHAANVLSRGDPPRALALLNEALVLFREMGDEIGAGSTLVTLGMVAHFLGDLEEAARWYDEAEPSIRRLGHRDELPWLLTRRGFLALDQGRTASARSYALEALVGLGTLTRRRNTLHTLALLASIAAAQARGGRSDAARRALELEGALLTHCAAAAVDPGTLDGRQVGRWLGEARRMIGAAEAEAAARRGAALGVEEALDLGAHARTRAPTRARRSGPAADDLTEREREVAALLARGRTNREIAAALTIAEGTAGLHARRVLAKLGLRSRAQLAARSVQVAAGGGA